MTGPVIVSCKRIREVVKLDESAITAVEQAFAKLANGNVIMPPVHQILVDDYHGQTCVKSAYVTGDPYFVSKAASTFHDNGRLGLPKTSGLMLVFDAQTGFVDTILLDDGYLTAMRTAAAGAVSAKWLSRPDADSAAIIGAGKQARLQLEALTLVRDIRFARLWSPTYDNARLAADELSKQLGFTVEAAASPQEAVRGAAIIVTTTPARSPVIMDEWVAQGTHITAMGSDAPGKQELDPALIKRAAPYVCDSREQCRTLGEWHAAIRAGVVSESLEAVEIGEIVAGSRPLARAQDAITVCDLTGLGVQDAEIALLARARA
ncbi:L-lysine cyclodeaminase [Tsuneonella dongtanensis]|uniref:L-lysine cyclodeaminase n=1 Tax=Tsuneonella dongtanensis TaxID=692370 RepID=A0A1B2A8Y4_9SPHN|nr:cyclodeaminase [Tsuneonella dongtanensis]ANY18633.1 L-lysine cyclodeaminase [Tsuneonella dongtanensis]